MQRLGEQRAPQGGQRGSASGDVNIAPSRDVRVDTGTRGNQGRSNEGGTMRSAPRSSSPLIRLNEQRQRNVNGGGAGTVDWPATNLPAPVATGGASSRGDAAGVERGGSPLMRLGNRTRGGTGQAPMAPVAERPAVAGPPVARLATDASRGLRDGRSDAPWRGGNDGRGDGGRNDARDRDGRDWNGQNRDGRDWRTDRGDSRHDDGRNHWNGRDGRDWNHHDRDRHHWSHDHRDRYHHDRGDWYKRDWNRGWSSSIVWRSSFDDCWWPSRYRYSAPVYYYPSHRYPIYYSGYHYPKTRWYSYSTWHAPSFSVTFSSYSTRYVDRCGPGLGFWGYRSYYQPLNTVVIAAPVTLYSTGYTSGYGSHTPRYDGGLTNGYTVPNYTASAASSSKQSFDDWYTSSGFTVNAGAPTTIRDYRTDVTTPINGSSLLGTPARTINGDAGDVRSAPAASYFRSTRVMGDMRWSDTPARIAREVMNTGAADRSARAAEYLGRSVPGAWEATVEEIADGDTLLLKDVSGGVALAVQLVSPATALKVGDRVLVNGRLVEIGVDDPDYPQGLLSLTGAKIERVN